MKMKFDWIDEEGEIRKPAFHEVLEGELGGKCQQSGLLQFSESAS